MDRGLTQAVVVPVYIVLALNASNDRLIRFDNLVVTTAFRDQGVLAINSLNEATAR